MGVKKLWDILKEGKWCDKKHIKVLRGERVAVDLSGWVVAAENCKELEGENNPHIRGVFERVYPLLLLNIRPIIVLEGKVPDVKEEEFRKRNCKTKFCKNSDNKDNLSRNSFNKRLNQCCELLETLGVPWIKSSGEAEALCALLNAKKIVAGVITNDGDTFLYGAHTVYKDFCIEKEPHISVFSSEDKGNKLKVNQRNLIALALLLKCDYEKGVPAIGKKKALRLLQELEGCDLLKRFQEWKEKDESELFPEYAKSKPVKRGTHCEICSHLGSYIKHKKKGCSMCGTEIACKATGTEKPCTCDWHIRKKRENEYNVYKKAIKVKNFPNKKAIKEFEEFNQDISGVDFDWKCPDLKQFQEKSSYYLGWTEKESFEKYFPIITSWQQYKRSKNDPTDDLYKPKKVLKACKLKDGEDGLKVQWRPSNGNRHSAENEEMYTEEYKDRFGESYPKIFDEFKKRVGDKNDTGCGSDKTGTEKKERNQRTELKESSSSEKRTQEQNINDHEPKNKKQCLQ